MFAPRKACRRIVCRNQPFYRLVLAAVIPLEHLELVREVLAREKVEKLAKQIAWDRVPQTLRPPQSWFDDIDNPFEPEEAPTP
jgi:hypothetical protein